MRNDANVLDRLLTGEQVEASPEVRELAQLAAVLQGAWEAAPTKAATTRTRTAVLSAFQVYQVNGNGNGNGSAARTASAPVVRVSRGRRVVARVALVAALVAGLPAAAWAASEDTVPGQLLYPVKRGLEEVRLALAGDPLDEARLLLAMAGERIEETLLSNALGLTSASAEAHESYGDVVSRLEAKVVEAQALGLPVQGFVAEAAELLQAYQQVLDALFGSPAPQQASQPTEVLSAEAPPEAADEAAGGGAEGSKKKPGKGDKKRDGKAEGRAGSNRGSGSAGATGGDGSGNQSAGGDGSGGKGSGKGVGGGAVGGSGDAKEEDPPQLQTEDEPEDDDGDGGSGSGSGSGSGLGLGHEKAIGEGHHKDNGEGHDEA